MVVSTQDYERLANTLKEDTGDHSSVVKGIRHSLFTPKVWALVDLEVLGVMQVDCTEGSGSVRMSGPVSIENCAAFTAEGAFEYFRPGIVASALGTSMDFNSEDKVFISELKDTEDPEIKLVVSSIPLKGRGPAHLATRNVCEMYILPVEKLNELMQDEVDQQILDTSKC